MAVRQRFSWPGARNNPPAARRLPAPSPFPDVPFRRLAAARPSLSPRHPAQAAGLGESQQLLPRRRRELRRQRPVPDARRRAAAGGAQVRTRPGEDVRLVADDPRALRVEPETSLGHRRDLDCGLGVGRRVVRHRHHDRDDAIAVAAHSGNQRAGTVLDPLLRSAPMIVGPQIAVTEEPADLRLKAHFASSSASRCSYPGAISLASRAAMSSSVRSSARTARRSRARRRSYSSYESTTLRGRPCLVISTGWLSERSSASPTRSWNSLALSVTVAMANLRFRQNSDFPDSMQDRPQPSLGRNRTRDDDTFHRPP